MLVCVSLFINELVFFRANLETTIDLDHHEHSNGTELRSYGPSYNMTFEGCGVSRKIKYTANANARPPPIVQIWVLRSLAWFICSKCRSSLFTVASIDFTYMATTPSNVGASICVELNTPTYCAHTNVLCTHQRVVQHAIDSLTNVRTLPKQMRLVRLTVNALHVDRIAVVPSVQVHQGVVGVEQTHVELANVARLAQVDLRSQ